MNELEPLDPQEPEQQELRIYDPCDPEKYQAIDHRVLYSTVALMMLSMILVGACSSHRVEQRDPIVIEPVKPGEGLTDLNGDAKPPTQQKRRGIPLKPGPDQKTPPCSPDAGEEPILGACYVALKKKPPCGPILLEHKDEQGVPTCYRAVVKAPREPSSIER